MFYTLRSTSKIFYTQVLIKIKVILKNQYDTVGPP